MTADEDGILNLTMPESSVTSSADYSSPPELPFAGFSTTLGPTLAVEHPPWLSDMEMVIRTYTIPSLCAIGILFNSTSAVVLYRSELQLRKSLIQLFAFLNTFDW